MKLSRKRISIPSTILVCLLMLVMLIPFYVMVVGAFKPNLSLISSPIDLDPTGELTIANFLYVFSKTEIFVWLRNSFTISILVALFTSFIGITAGYAFAKIKFRGKGVFFLLVMATLMLPKQILLIPNYLVAYSFNLQNTLIGVVLTSIAPAFGIFLSRQFISKLPSELFDAASIDGCGELRKFTRIVLPLSLPAVGTISIFSFFATFNDYLWQLIMISDTKLKTLPIGIAMFAQSASTQKGYQLAAACIAAAPLIILFIFLQKFFIKGATSGAIKG